MKQIRQLIKKEGTPYAFLSGYLILFVLFIVLPVIAGVALSFTQYDTVQMPKFLGLKNYIDLITQDRDFMQYVLPNTIQFSLFVGVGGYILAFLLAWVLAQITYIPRTIIAIVIYSPSLTSAAVMTTIWRTMFSGNEYGYINSILLNMGLVETPIQFLQSPDYLMLAMIVVAIWNSMGIGFLAMLAGILNVNTELYEAGAIDGIKNRAQEILYITIPSMKPQMLFGAVMAIVNAFNVSGIGVTLSGQNPTPQNAGQLIVTHLEDFSTIRYEMGYAAALSVVLLLFVYGVSKIAFRLFADND